MKRNISSSVIFLIFLIVSGCASRKKAIPPAAEKPADVVAASTAEVLSAISAAGMDFSTISLKTKADLSINENRNDVTLNIRIKRDEAIWISVTAIAGLEVARALITPDSIKILNRVEGEYTHKPFNSIHQFTNEQLNFGMLQAILVGNAVPEFVTGASKVDTSPQLRLTGIRETLNYNLTFSDTFKLLQADLKDAAAGQTLIVNYGNFGLIGTKIFPQSVSIRSRAGNKSVAAEFRYTKIDANIPVDMPFNVPARFAVKN